MFENFVSADAVKEFKEAVEAWTLSNFVFTDAVYELNDEVSKNEPVPFSKSSNLVSKLADAASKEDVFNFVFIVFSKAPVAAASSASVTYPLSNDEENERSCSMEAVAEALNEFCDWVKALNEAVLTNVSCKDAVNSSKLFTSAIKEAVVLFMFVIELLILADVSAIEAVYNPNGISSTNENIISALNVLNLSGVMNAVLLFGNNTSFSTNNCCFVFFSAIS
jgi:hypothetical protein